MLRYFTIRARARRIHEIRLNRLTERIFLALRLDTNHRMTEEDCAQAAYLYARELLGKAGRRQQAVKLLMQRWRILSLLSIIPDHVWAWCGFCPYCYTHSITVGKRPTRILNWETSCIDCWEEHDEYWQRMWDDFAGCL